MVIEFGSRRGRADGISEEIVLTSHILACQFWSLIQAYRIPTSSRAQVSAATIIQTLCEPGPHRQATTQNRSRITSNGSQITNQSESNDKPVGVG